MVFIHCTLTFPKYTGKEAKKMYLKLRNRQKEAYISLQNHAIVLATYLFCPRINSLDQWFSNFHMAQNPPGRL